MKTDSNQKVAFRKKTGFFLFFNLFLWAGFFLIFITQRLCMSFGQVTLDQMIFYFRMPKGEVNSDLTANFLKLDCDAVIVLCFLAFLAVFSFALCFPCIAAKFSGFLQSISRHIVRSFTVLFFLLLATGVTLFFSGSNYFLYFYNILFIVLILFLASLIKQCAGIFSSAIRHIALHLSQFLTLTSIFFFCGSLIYFLDTFEIGHTLYCLMQESTLIDEHYTTVHLDDFHFPDEQNQEPRRKKHNLVLIICESMESTFSNPSICGDNLIPELTDLMRKNDSVPDYVEVSGANYTIASLYSLFYGLPLLYYPRFGGNLNIGKNVFGKNSLSIFEILSANGYDIYFLQGASLIFARKDLLFEHIPNAKVIGLDQIPKNEYSSKQTFGIWDRDLFRIAKKKLDEAYKQNKPFSFTLLTVDNHSDGEHQPDSPVIHHDIRDNIRQDSRLISGFVDWLQQQPFADETVIVVIGDHNIWVDKVGTDLSCIKTRRVFNCILNNKNGLRLKQNKKAAMFDFAPTVLDAMGISWDSYSLGIGKSLYRDTPTILDQYDVNTWNEESMKRSAKYNELVQK